MTKEKRQLHKLNVQTRLDFRLLGNNALQGTGRQQAEEVAPPRLQSVGAVHCPEIDLKPVPRKRHILASQGDALRALHSRRA